MTHTRHEYRTEHFREPPAADQLNQLARQGWRLVSVTLDVGGGNVGEARYIAFLERPALSAATVAAARPELGGTTSARAARPRHESESLLQFA